jgi:tRNA pseudouridine38-40 synthase
MPRWLVEFGYDGGPFDGWARQPGRRTVEGTIVEGLGRLRLPGAPREGPLEVASRTDRGVSARANALVLHAALPPGPLLRALNGIAPEIRFTRAAEVPDGFRVREAVFREYRYFLDPEEPHRERWTRAARPLLQPRIDVRSLGRGLPTGAPTWRTVDAIGLEEGAGGPFLRVRARSYVWGMVRKIVSALRQRAAGELTEGELREALAGARRLTLPLADPEPLVLWEVHHEVRWSPEPGRPSRHQLRYFDRERVRARLRGRLLGALEPVDRSAGGDPAPAPGRGTAL